MDRIPSGVEPRQDECMKIRADKHIEADDGSQIPLGIHRLADRIDTGPFWAGRGIRAFAVLMPTPKRPREDECMGPGGGFYWPPGDKHIGPSDVGGKGHGPENGVVAFGGFGDFAPYPVGWDTMILGVKNTTDPYIMGDVVFTKPAGGRDWPIFGGGGMWDKYLDWEGG